MRLEFETIRFFPGKEGVRGTLLKYFTFELSHEELASIGDYRVEAGALHIEAHEKKRRRVLGLIANALQDLTCTITKNPARYIDRTSGVPLIGSLEFGIIDRGTNLIEVRPASGCNLACVYCSVAEGPQGPKVREFVVEKEYLLEEFDKLAAIKEHPIEVFIETQGEPLLYADLPGMIRDLKARGDVKQVTMVTNGTFLTPEKIAELAEAGLDRINWSINSLDPQRAQEIAGTRYDVERIKSLIEEAYKHLDVLLCPVIMKGVNDDEMEAFVTFAKPLRDKEPVVGFQNFLYYKGGRNPVPEAPMEWFEERLAALEEKHGRRLRVDAQDFTIEYDAAPEKPFKKKDIVEVERLFPGRLKNETMCKASGRLVKVIGRVPDKERFKVQILRDKHNIFLAKALA